MDAPDISPPAADAAGDLQAPLRLPFAFARRHGVLIAGHGSDAVHVVCRDDTDADAVLEVRRYARRPLALERVSADAFEAALQKNYEQGSAQTRQMMEDLGEGLDLSEIAQQLGEPQDLLEHADDAPIIRLINALLAEAIRENASDVHIEPFEGRLVVRLRVDGVLREVLEPPRALAPIIVSRIKVMAKLDIAEKRLPMDGRISLRIANRPVDVRVSTMPSGHGERVVLRLLDKQAGRLSLEQIGMNERLRATVDGLIRKPHGIILVTGPTGSGKTTTLYAAISRLNDASRNVMTVEDPIEYYLDGIAQSQVNTKVDLTFARGLRAMLRQDPDVVMVGEIRDLETAQIAVQASLTGHLVLSTLHTNTAVGAVTRLRDMGTEPFLLASSLLGVLAQRLVRVLCPHCKEAHRGAANDPSALGIGDADGATLFRAKGCRECGFSGYRGRTGIYELVSVDETLRTMIHDGAGEHELEHYARAHSPGIRRDGCDKVIAGVTSLEEVLRVTREG